MKWGEVKSLGDRILFLGDNCGFSARASDFSNCKGNCVFFTDESTDYRGICVFDMDKGCIKAISDNSSQLLRIPPYWLHQNMVALEVSVLGEYLSLYRFGS